jgi:hypothetical protein
MSGRSAISGRSIPRRSKLKLMPPHVRAEWLAARTALELRQIIRAESDDSNELGQIERALFARLRWTEAELTGQP